MHNHKNSFQFEGNLGADAKTTKISQDAIVVTFSVAVNKKWKDKQNNQVESTHWFDVEVWGRATAWAKTLKKGMPVMVEGEVKTGSYIAEDECQSKHKTWTITANTIRKIDFSQPDDAEE